MTIFFVGLGLFVLGVVLNAIGWKLHFRGTKGVPKEFLAWLLEVIRNWFGLLTGPTSTTGQRLAAFGAIVAALGLVTTVGGLIAWVA
jgi:hypothetical protein